MEVTWNTSVALWWSFTWRLGVFAVPCSIAIGVLGAPVADALGIPERHSTFALFAGLLLWIPGSIFALRSALRRRADKLSLTSNDETWASILLIWWGMLWRCCIYGALIGLLLGILVSILVGRPSQHPGYLVLGWLFGLGPGVMVAIKRAVEAWTDLHKPL